MGRDPRQLEDTHERHTGLQIARRTLDVLKEADRFSCVISVSLGYSHEQTLTSVMQRIKRRKRHTIVSNTKIDSSGQRR